MVEQEERSYPVPEAEEDRLADLYNYGILDTAPEGTYDHFTRLAAHICGTELAAITFIDEARQWVKAEMGEIASQITSRSESFCTHAIVDPDEVYVVEDALDHPDFEDNPYVKGDPHLRFYAGSPIQSHRGHGLGTVCVLDTEPGTLTESETQALASLSHAISLSLELRLVGRNLQLAHEDTERITQAVTHTMGDLVGRIGASLQVIESQTEDIDERSLEEIETAREATRALHRSIQGLDRYSRFAGKLDPMSTFSLTGALDEAQDDLRSLLETAGARVQAHALPNVVGDRDQIVALFEKLLSNVAQHAGPDTTVHVTAHRNDDVWRIEVADDGPGIEPEDQEEIFEMFEQGEQAEDTQSPGVGLVICKRIVDRHGGQIGVDSTPGEGATFWFTLPGPDE